MSSLKVTLSWRHVEGCIAFFIWAGLQAFSFSAYLRRNVSFRYSYSNQSKDEKMLSNSFGRRAWKQRKYFFEYFIKTCIQKDLLIIQVEREGCGVINLRGSTCNQTPVFSVLGFIKCAVDFSLLCWQLKTQVLWLRFPFCETGDDIAFPHTAELRVWLYL